MRNAPENQHALSHKKLAFPEHQSWGSFMMILSSLLTKFRSCRGKLIKKSRTRNILWRYQSKDWKWPGLLDLNDLNDLNDLDHCGFCGASATLPVSRNLAIKRWIVLLSGTLFLRKSLLHCWCVRRTDFVAKYTSIIFTGCCVVNCPVESILVSKESPRPAV